MDSETVTAPVALRQRVFDSIGAQLPQVLGHTIPPVTGQTRLMEDLGLRSATMLELLLELEQDLDIEIDVEDIDADDMSTVGDLADYVAGHAITE